MNIEPNVTINRAIKVPNTFLLYLNFSGLERGLVVMDMMILCKRLLAPVGVYI